MDKEKTLRSVNKKLDKRGASVYKIDIILDVIDRYYDFLIDLGVLLDRIYDCGFNGCAFETTDYFWTAKISSDEDEYRFYDTPNLISAQPHIEFLDWFPDEGKGRAFLVIREAVDPLPRRQMPEASREIIKQSKNFINITDINSDNIGISRMDGRYVLFDGRFLD